jgi:hypothetical protein
VKQRRGSIARYLLLGCLVGCTSTRSDVRSFDDRYFGTLQNECYPQARNVWIDVWNGGFTLPLPFSRQITGTVSASGDLSGSGTWEGPSGEEVQGMLEGRILSPWFGNALLAEVAYGDCEFRLNLAPRVRRTVNQRLPRTGRIP